MRSSPESLSGSQPAHQPDMKLITQQKKTATCCFRHPQTLRDTNTKGEIKNEAAGSVAKTLTDEEYAIHKAHREACEAEQQLYRDPSTGYKVFTEHAHLRRGTCCGSACRHCPYSQANVKDPALKKRFNSAFYV
ncbi:unnamed protein product [Arctogadus glacialis]